MEKILLKYLPKGNFGHVSSQRSQVMAGIKGRGNRTTEARLRLALVRSGISGWRIRPRGIIGSPDFYFPHSKTAVFVDGCFWHGCPRCGHIPKKNHRFWNAKLRLNRQRDRKVTRMLRFSGFSVVRLWEHDLANGIGQCIRTIRQTLGLGSLKG